MDPKDLELINNILDRDITLKEKIKDHISDFDKKTRIMVGTLNKIHSTPKDQISVLLDSAQLTLESCSETMEAIANLIPPNQFWRYKDIWTHSIRSAVFSAALVKFLRSGELISSKQTAETLGIKDEWKNRFELATEDYLHGLISLVNELSRLAVNAVTLGDFERPIQISLFVKDIYAGFSVLNLKNDLLRRRFDSLKYDIKKIEEVVYDVSLRRLIPLLPQETENAQ